MIEEYVISYREATSYDVEEMLLCRAGDPEAGPGDPRMRAYFDGEHHPREALLPRVGFVALRGDQVVGYIAGHLTRRYDCDGEVQYLYVTPSERQHGVATKLLALTAEWFGRNGAKRVCVNADVDSAGAVPFYESSGAVPLSKFWYVWEDIAVILNR